MFAFEKTIEVFQMMGYSLILVDYCIPPFLCVLIILSPSVNSLAIAKEGELTIGTIDDIQKLHIRSIPLGEHARRICHQEQTRTFAICSLKYNQASAEDSEMHFIRLLDDQTFDIVSTYALDTYECGCSILSCSFSDDSNVYYCVGTAYVLPEENEPTKVEN